MLEHVTLGQTRFHVPGLAPDPRGVALGRQGAFLMPSIDRVVQLFRILSSEQSLDDVLPSLKIHKVKSPVGALSMLVSFDVATSYALDRAARACRLAGGIPFTGSGKHYVQWRDERSPFGYDVDVVSTDRGDVVLYSDDLAAGYQREGEIAFAQIVLRLELSRVQGTPEDEKPASLYLTVALGLGEQMVRYLVRNRVHAEVALVRPRDAGAFRADRGGFLLVRADALPERMERLFTAVPGIELYQPVSENVAVEQGFRHPIYLPACASLFPREFFYLFAGVRRAVEMVPGPLELTPAENLTRIQFLGTGGEKSHAAAVAPRELEVVVQLAPSSAPPARVVGALVPWAQAAWLKKLVYAVPPASLHGHRAALLEEGILILARPGTDVIPLGQLLYDSGNGIVIPVGFELRPRVSSEVLAERLGHGPTTLTVFALGASKPFSIDDGQLGPLERKLVIDIDVAPARPAGTRRIDTVAASEVVNDPIGTFALWGFQADVTPEPPALPPGEKKP